MNRLSTGIIISAILMSAPSIASADPQPKNAQPASAAKIAKAYAGKTDLWETDCGGGIYFGPNGQARAWCADNPNVLGVGTWSADDTGQLCHKLRWFARQGSSRATSGPVETTCIAHLDKRWGDLYRSFPGDNEWWALNEFSGLTRGYKYQANVKAARAKLGL